MASIIIGVFIAIACVGIIFAIVNVVKNGVSATALSSVAGFAAAIAIGICAEALIVHAQTEIAGIKEQDEGNQQRIEQLLDEIDDMKTNAENPYSTLRIIYSDGHEKVFNVDAGKEAIITIAGDEPIANIMLEK